MVAPLITLRVMLPQRIKLLVLQYIIYYISMGRKIQIVFQLNIMLIMELTQQVIVLEMVSMLLVAEL